MFEEISTLLQVIDFTLAIVRTVYFITYWLGSVICWSVYFLCYFLYTTALNIVYGLHVAVEDFGLFLSDLFTILTSFAELLTTIDFGFTQMDFQFVDIFLPFVLIRDFVLVVGFSVWKLANKLIEFVVYLNNCPHVAAVLVARCLESLLSDFPFESFTGLCILSAFTCFIYKQYPNFFNYCLDFVKLICSNIKICMFKAVLHLGLLMLRTFSLLTSLFQKVYFAFSSILKCSVKNIVKKTPTKAALKIQLEDEKAVRLCIICFDRLRNSIVLNCRHLCMCSNCAEVIFSESRECPICRSHIEDIITVFT